MTDKTSNAVERKIPLKGIRLTISIVALLLAFLHIFCPLVDIDSIALVLLAVAALPWVTPLVKSIELPGGLKLEFAEISKKIIENKVSGEQKESLTRQQVIAENSWDSGYYKLYSNGVLTQRFQAMLLAGREQSDLTLPIAFPNEVTSIQVIGDRTVQVSDISNTRIQLRYEPQTRDKKVTLIVSGL